MSERAREVGSGGDDDVPTLPLRAATPATTSAESDPNESGSFTVVDE
ncbi:hypothetical protein [Haloprofundus salinisoli]|nr:hypothetical protein [Haloprofundus salinisoli]